MRTVLEVQGMKVAAQEPAGMHQTDIHMVDLSRMGPRDKIDTAQVVLAVWARSSIDGQDN